MHDALGDRMKGQYEDRTRFVLPRRTYTLARVDGKAFHSYTRECWRPFDYTLMAHMDQTARRMCEHLQGSKLAYVQSDEISVLLADFDNITTEAAFDGNVQKIASIAASMATAYFNDFRGGGRAMFDGRVFTIPDPTEVENYFIWRQSDATRNSVQMAAQAIYSHSQLHGVNTSGEMQELLMAKGINWNDYPTGAKRGRCVVRVPEAGWMVDVDPPIFTKDRDYLRMRIPRYEADQGAAPGTAREGREGAR